MTHRIPALANSIASRLASTSKALAGLGLATLLLGVSGDAFGAQTSISTNTGFWTADDGGSTTDFNNSYSPIFTLLPYASLLHIAAGDEYAHSHGGPLVVGVQVLDVKTGKWITIQTIRLNNGDELNYGGLNIPFIPTSITQVRLFSSPGQFDSFHDWNNVTFTFGQATINAVGHTWKGSGFVPGGFANLGTLNPGTDHPLEIGNYFLQADTGKLVIKLAAKDKFTLLKVGNGAVLGGALETQTVHGFKAAPGQKFTFLTANDGILGTFDTVGTGTILGLKLIYDFNSTTLQFTQGSFEEFAAGAHLSPNQYAVAEALDKEISTGHSQRLIRYMDNERFADLPHAFDKLAPEELTSIFTIGVSLAQVQSGNIQRRTDDIRSGSNGFSAAGLAVNGAGPSYSGGFGITTGVAGPSGNDGKESKEVKSVVAPENRWGAFLSGTGEWVSVGNTDNARAYDLESGGFTLGVDYKLTPNLAIGVAAGYTNTTAHLTDDGRVRVNGGKIGLYGTFFQNAQVTQAPTMSKDSSKDSSKEAPVVSSIAKGFYADVAVFGGYNSYSSRRSAIQGDARGDTDGGELNALVGLGYDFKQGNLTFGPTASFNYTYVGTSEFTEHGSLAPLNVHGGQADSLRSAFGLKASYDWKVGSVVIKPEIRAAWQHEYGDAAYELSSSFANGSGDSFTVNGPQIGRDSVLLGAGFAIQCSERCSTFFYYDGELGRKDYQSTAVTGGFRLAF